MGHTEREFTYRTSGLVVTYSDWGDESADVAVDRCDSAGDLVHWMLEEDYATDVACALGLRLAQGGTLTDAEARAFLDQNRDSMEEAAEEDRLSRDAKWDEDPCVER